MESNDDALKKKQVVDARARNISHNVRYTECGSQSIEDSQADIAILLRRLIRDEIQSGKSDKEIYKNSRMIMERLYYMLQSLICRLQPCGYTTSSCRCCCRSWAYNEHRKRTNMHIMALNLVRGVPITPKEKETMLEILTPPPPERASPSSLWRKWCGQ